MQLLNHAATTGMSYVRPHYSDDLTAQVNFFMAHHDKTITE